MLKSKSSKIRPKPEESPVTAAEARQLFADWKNLPAMVLAVSGGPDSVALMWLAARWRGTLKKPPRLLAVTVDHGLREEAVREAREVKRLASALDIEHRTVRWSAPKPDAGIPAAARAARYDLLGRAARRHGATHVFTAHTRDDQAETVLMRLSRGSGITGLAAMARQSVRGDVIVVRPFLDVPKSRLVATLRKAGIAFADDPTNRDPRFTRPRLRALMPALAAEGADARGLSRLAARLGRANAALEIMADGAERYLAAIDAGPGYDLAAFAALSEEIRLRLLLRRINRAGHEGPAELGKAEALLRAIDGAAGRAKPRTGPVRLKQTLAGAIVSVQNGRIHIAPAPRRRRMAGLP